MNNSLLPPLLGLFGMLAAFVVYRLVMKYPDGEDKVKKIVSDQLGTAIDEIQSDSSFVDDLGADSLDTVELVMALEEEFDLEIADEDAEKISTVNEAVDYINSNS